MNKKNEWDLILEK